MFVRLCATTGRSGQGTEGRERARRVAGTRSSLSLSCEERGSLPRRARSGETLPQIEPHLASLSSPLPALDPPLEPREQEDVWTRRLTPRSPISTLQQVLKPEKRYECLSYLPPLSDEEISRQIDYLVGNGWAPCIEFASQEEADTNQLFFAGPALYENRYWTMWKLPMFGCQSGDEVLAEIQNCQDEYPGYRVRVVGFDNVRQCQMAGFICRK